MVLKYLFKLKKKTLKLFEKSLEKKPKTIVSYFCLPII